MFWYTILIKVILLTVAIKSTEKLTQVDLAKPHTDVALRKKTQLPRNKHKSTLFKEYYSTSFVTENSLNIF